MTLPGDGLVGSVAHNEGGCNMKVRGGVPASKAGEPPYAYHDDWSVAVAAAAEDVFAYVDDQMRLSSHMRQSSWKMGAGKMTIELDAGGGKQVGSLMRLSGRAFGLTLSV